MTELEDLLNDIEELRKNLNSLINDKNMNLADAEILAASQILNVAITKYNEIVTKKIKKWSSYFYRQTVSMQ